jgi:Ca-activated chloride channel family protein
MASGIEMALHTVDGLSRNGRVPRVVLLSDGHANEGDASFRGLVARARRAAIGEYVLSTVGVGEGFDENLMTALADAGTGNFYYVQRSEELAEIFAAEFASARETVATALEVQITSRPGVEILSASGYPIERVNGQQIFRPGSLFGGQERRIWVTVRVPTGGEETIEIGDFRLSFVSQGTRHILGLAETPKLVLVDQEKEYLASLDADTWANAVVEDELGELKALISADLQAGERDQALGRFRGFVSHQRALNQGVASPKVAEAIAEVEKMKEEVESAFEDAEPARTNRLSKKLSAEGYDERRPGAKYK